MQHSVFIALFTIAIGTSTALAESPIIDTSVHGSVGSGVTVRPDFDDVAGRSPHVNSVSVSMEFRALYRGHVGIGLTLLDTWGSNDGWFVGAGGGIRARLTPPAADWDLTMGYDARFLRINQSRGGFFVPDVHTSHFAHALSLRLERRVRSGIARVGGVVQAGFAGSDARWASLGLSVGFGTPTP